MYIKTILIHNHEFQLATGVTYSTCFFFFWVVNDIKNHKILLFLILPQNFKFNKIVTTFIFFSKSIIFVQKIINFSNNDNFSLKFHFFFLILP